MKPEVSWPYSQLISVAISWATSIHSILSHPNPSRWFLMCTVLPYCIQSLPYVFWLKCCMNFSHILCMLHFPSIKLSLIWWPLYLANSTNYECHGYKILWAFQLFPLPKVHIFSLATFSNILSLYISTLRYPAVVCCINSCGTLPSHTKTKT